MKILSMLRAGAVSALLAVGISTPANAVTFTVDPGATWLGYMNVFELPSNGGAFVFGSGWGTGDLNASFTGPTLRLSPNTIGDPNPFWYIGGAPGPGNKIMEANFYQQFDGPLAGQTVNFTGLVLSNSFIAHNAIAFIKDFAPDYSSFNQTTIALTPGAFNISLLTINDPARHVQFGFQVTGENVWATNVAPFGFADVTAIPEPSTYAAIAGVLALALAARRARKA